MSPKKAALLTLLLFLSLFTFQLLWTHGQLEQLRSLGRRGLRRRAQQQAAAAHTAAINAGLDDLVGIDGSGSGRAADVEVIEYGEGPSKPSPALIVFAFNRASSLLRLPGLKRYSVYVSQVGWWGDACGARWTCLAGPVAYQQQKWQQSWAYLS
jgi:hypothetical protein